MKETILSIDVGTKNLAYCIIEKEDDDFKILKWDIINLYDHVKKCEYKKCSKDADYSVNDTNYYCIAHKYDDDLTNKIRKITKASRKLSFDELTIKLYKELNKRFHFYWNLFDKVLIENQPSLKNPIMKSISVLLYSYFTIYGTINYELCRNEPIKEIKFINPSNKLKICKEITDNVIKTDNKAEQYKLTKKLGVKYCESLISIDELAILRDHKKADDMADSFLQGFQYLFNPVPEKYADKLIKIGFDN